MTLTEVLRVLEAIEGAGCRVWLEGGWGVDALVGHQTRPHRDLDIDVDADQEAQVLAVLEALDYTVETDWRPNRVELVAPGRGWVDVHPLVFGAEGDAYQVGLDGEHWPYAAKSFTRGLLGGRVVGCLTAAQQIEWHSGYELRASDHADLAHLHALEAQDGRGA